MFLLTSKSEDPDKYPALIHTFVAQVSLFPGLNSAVISLSKLNTVTQLLIL